MKTPQTALKTTAIRRRLSDDRRRISSMRLRARREATASLIDAVLYGTIADVRERLAAGADANLKSKAGEPALLLAVYSDGNEPVVDLLLNAGADVNTPDPDGTTPLIAAVRPAGSAVVKLLVEHGASIDVCNQHGDTPLTNAAIWGSTDVVRYLVEHGADIKLADGAGLAAIDLARQHDHPGIVALLQTAAESLDGSFRRGRRQINRGVGKRPSHSN